MNGSGAQSAMYFFLLFVATTLAITWWAARRTRTSPASGSHGNSFITSVEGRVAGTATAPIPTAALMIRTPTTTSTRRTCRSRP